MVEIVQKVLIWIGCFFGGLVVWFFLLTGLMMCLTFLKHKYWDRAPMRFVLLPHLPLFWVGVFCVVSECWLFLSDGYEMKRLGSE